jgi:2-polyprenyl-6-methoxyphenol hydroxylase-like FAD-dependent oxidoreductase
MTPPRILIAGAGIAGLALKHALTTSGIDADIVERDPSPRISGTGLALRALRALGLSEEVKQLAEPVLR